MHDPGSTCQNASNAVLAAKGLRKTYNGRAVVDGVTITALREELVTVIRMLTGQPPAIKGELTAQALEA